MIKSIIKHRNLAIKRRTWSIAGADSFVLATFVKYDRRVEALDHLGVAVTQRGAFWRGLSGGVVCFRCRKFPRGCDHNDSSMLAAGADLGYISVQDRMGEAPISRRGSIECEGRRVQSDQMDALTDQAVALLRRDGRMSFSEIARVLGVSRRAVATRIGPLLDSKKLHIVAAVHPDAIGLHVQANTSVRVDGDSTSVAQAVVENVASAVFIAEAIGPHRLTVETHTRTLAEVRSVFRFISALPGVVGLEFLVYEHVYRSFFPEVEPVPQGRALDMIDRKIITELFREGRATYERLAEVSNMSIGATRARLLTLLEGGIVHVGAIEPRIGATTMLSFGMGISVTADPQAVVTWLIQHSNVEFLALTVGRFELVATLNFSSLPDKEAFVAELGSMTDVRTVTSWLLSRVYKEAYRRPEW